VRPCTPDDGKLEAVSSGRQLSSSRDGDGVLVSLRATAPAQRPARREEM
jgi:hypothetical protein